MVAASVLPLFRELKQSASAIPLGERREAQIKGLSSPYCVFEVEW
jgi:hypothetical protein